ncbi:porin, partial [Lutibacter sp.]|uniref:OprO/OprP family phosphate-selective porin n=1 Tax=Lutibacter sp. TaxID=1925666 RepID=UPI0025B9B046
HLGLAYSYRTPDESKYSLESRPEAHLLTSYINTGMIDLVDNVKLTGFEVALVLNSFSIQSEYIHSRVNRENLFENYNFFGYYVEASYFVTGEHKNYSKKVGYFKRVSPKSNFNPTGNGVGAIELVARYSSADYSDKSVEGGILNDMTVGINWHLNPVTKFSIDYTSAKLKSVGNSNIVQMKFQVAF